MGGLEFKTENKRRRKSKALLTGEMNPREETACGGYPTHLTNFCSCPLYQPFQILPSEILMPTSGVSLPWEHYFYLLIFALCENIVLPWVSHTTAPSPLKGKDTFCDNLSDYLWPSNPQSFPDKKNISDSSQSNQRRNQRKERIGVMVWGWGEEIDLQDLMRGKGRESFVLANRHRPGSSGPDLLLMETHSWGGIHYLLENCDGVSQPCTSALKEGKKL